MIVVRITGGLGNQMFQYAVFKKFIEMGKNAKMDLSFYDLCDAHNGYELPKIFAIYEQYATIEEARKWGCLDRNRIKKCYHKLLKHKEYKWMFTRFEQLIYNPSRLFTFDDAYIDGCWQSEKYFESIKDIIRDDFEFILPLGEMVERVAEEIVASNSVSIHVRRGDYLEYPGLASVCTLKYYENAIAKIDELVENAKYFVFSNDIIWCRQNLKIPNATYIDYNTKSDSYKDMQLMSLCKHNIIANSTFSWWGAWLNKNKNKIVITPKIYKRNDFVKNDIIPNGWYRVGI